MRRQLFKLTPAGVCDNPACGAPVFAELVQLDPSGFRLCVDCTDEHAPRLREVVADGEAARTLYQRSGGRLPPHRGNPFTL
jgi:hypothetical protein